MARKIVDLTGPSSDIEEAQTNSRKRQRSGKSKSPIKRNAPAPHVLSAGLEKAIDGMSVKHLKRWVIEFALTNPEVARRMGAEYLVLGREVVRYHADSDSEDRAQSEEEEDDSEDDVAEGAEERPGKKLKAIGAGDEEMVPRKAVCENCKEKFDVTVNEGGDCRWHSGVKEVDYDADFWADHDEDCHGPMDSFGDDPDFAEGYVWSCYENNGDDEGCKSTKHKAAVNMLCSRL